jgi:hypothetical protein
MAMVMANVPSKADRASFLAMVVLERMNGSRFTSRKTCAITYITRLEVCPGLFVKRVDAYRTQMIGFERADRGLYCPRMVDLRSSDLVRTRTR